ncbi:MAG: histidine triad nucleotide-binding protein [Pirellulaceae bacterium]
MPEKTIFKKIIDGEIPANIIHDDEHCLVFHDISPKAPVHVLVIPKKEIATLDDIADEDQALMGHLWLVVRDVARKLGLEEGYRVIVNCKENGGQEVPHVHLHVMGGRRLNWPPG